MIELALPRSRNVTAWIFPSAGYFFLALFIGALFAFWPPYLSRLPNDDIFAHLHAVTAVLWCALLIAQPLLVRRHRNWHRFLGHVSKAVAPLFLLAAILLAHHRVRVMDDAKFARQAPSLYLGLVAIALFAVSYALALRYRRTQALHARFMIATGLTMIDPVLVRILSFYAPRFVHPLAYQVWGYGVTDLILVALLWRPVMSAGHRRIYLGGISVFAIGHLAWFTVVQGPLWLPFAYWFRALPLP